MSTAYFLLLHLTLIKNPQKLWVNYLLSQILNLQCVTALNTFFTVQNRIYALDITFKISFELSNNVFRMRTHHLESVPAFCKGA